MRVVFIMRIKDSSWRLKFWRVPHLGNLELIHALNITHDYPRHIHEEYCLVIMLQGVETHICRGKSYKAFAGCLMLLNADEAHSSKSVGTEYRIIRISPKELGRIGFEGRFDYAAIGTVVNLAARLCSEAVDGQILIERKVHAAVEALVSIEPVREFLLKGLHRPVAAFNVCAVSR